MQLAGIREGDIVRIAGSLAFVTGKEPGRLSVTWLRPASAECTSFDRTVTARQVEAHWRRK